MQRKTIIATVEVENPEWESSSFINCLTGTQKWRDFFKMPQSITINLSGTSTDDTSNNLTNRFIASSKSHISSLFQKCKSKFFSEKISTDNGKENANTSQIELLLKRLQNLEDYIRNIQQPSKDTMLLIPPKEKENLQSQNLPRFSETRDSCKLYTIRENCSENNLHSVSRCQDMNSNVPSWRLSPIKCRNASETCPACRKEYIITFDACNRIINRGRNYIRRSNLCPACIYERPCKLSSCEIGTERYPISCGTNLKYPEQELRNILPENSLSVKYVNGTNPNKEKGLPNAETGREPSFIRKESYRRSNFNSTDGSPDPIYRPSVNPSNEDKETLRDPSFLRKDSYRRNNSNAYTDGPPRPHYRPSVNQSNPNDDYNREVQQLTSLYSQDDSLRTRDESIIRTRTSEAQYIDNQNNDTNKMRSSGHNNIAKSRPMSIVQEADSEERYFTDENRNSRMSRKSLRNNQMEGEVFNQNQKEPRLNRTNSLSYDTKPEIDRPDFQRNTLPRKSINGNRFIQTQDSIGANRIRESVNNGVRQDMEEENVARNSNFRRTQAENRDFTQTRESLVNNRSSSINYDADNRNKNSILISNNFAENTELQNDEYKPRPRSVRPSPSNVVKGENRGPINEIRYVVDDNNNNNVSDTHQSRNANLRNSSYHESITEPNVIEGAPYYNMFHKKPSTVHRELFDDDREREPRKSGYKRTTIIDPDPSNYNSYSQVVTETVTPRSQYFAFSNQDSDDIARRSGYKRTTIVEGEPSNYKKYSEVVKETVRPGNQSFAMNDEVLDIEKQFSISVPEKLNVIVCQFGKGDKVTTTQEKPLMFDFCSCTNDVDADVVALSRKSSMKNPSASIVVKDCQIKCDENESQVAILSTQLEKQAEDIDDLKKIVMTCLQQMEQIKSGDLGTSQDTSYFQRKPCTGPCAPKERYLFKTSVINVKQDKAVYTNSDKMQQTNKNSNEPCSCCTCDIEKRLVEENMETNIKNCGKCVCDCKCCQEKVEVVQSMKDKEIKNKNNNI